MKESFARAGLGILIACALTSVPAAAQQAAPNASSSLAALRAGFAAPPQQARLRCYWWWLNGNTDEATITRDLEQMAAKGFGGAILVDADGASQNGNRPVPAGPRFGSPAWTRLYLHALKEADRLGLEISLNILSGWNTGGPDVKPEEASKLLTWSRKDVTGGQDLSLRLDAPFARLGFYREIAVLAYPLHHGAALQPSASDRDGRAPSLNPPHANALQFRSAAAEMGFSMPDASWLLNAGPHADDPSLADTRLDEVRDITTHVHDGMLTWHAPPGEWEILRIGYTASGARVSTSSDTWKGLAIDYLDHRAFDRYWTNDVQPLLEAARPYLGRSLKYLVSDSWELGGTNWTDNFREQFVKHRGYDPVRYLPIVAGRIVDDRDHSTRFLTDLRRTVADLVTEEHYDVFAAHAKQYGLGIHPESGGPHGAPIDAIETFRSAAFPQTEYWAPSAHRPTDADRFFTKEAASAANIYGKPFAAQEGMTSVGPQWSESPANDLKPAFDQAITEGMTRLIWHEFTSSPARFGLPGQEYFAGTHLNPNVTWWSAAGDLFAYMNRVQFLMQQGVAVNDVLYDYGDNVPSFVRLKADDPAHALPGFDYDVTDEDALLHALRDEGAQLAGPAGNRWQLLVLPKTRRLSLAALLRVRAYVENGGTLAGLAPESPTGNVTADDLATFRATTHALFGDACSDGATHTIGHGRVLCTQDAHRALTLMQVAPDFSSSLPQVDYVHRRIGTTDLYFVRNTSAAPLHATLTLRVAPEGAEAWDALRGTSQPLSVEPSGERSRVNVALAAHGSTVLVFDPSLARTTESADVNLKKASDSAGTPVIVTPRTWTLSFEARRGAPSAPQHWAALESWTNAALPGIRYFSGTAAYTTALQLSAAQARRGVMLELTDVREIAQVWVNGVLQGGIWAHPFQLELHEGLRAGDNELRIEVSNGWPNRIIGDAQPNAGPPVTHTNITAYTATSPLLPSGLIGPVTVRELP